jgi:hypothetical protein
MGFRRIGPVVAQSCRTTVSLRCSTDRPRSHRRHGLRRRPGLARAEQRRRSTVPIVDMRASRVASVAPILTVVQVMRRASRAMHGIHPLRVSAPRQRARGNARRQLPRQGAPEHR